MVQVIKKMSLPGLGMCVFLCDTMLVGCMVHPLCAVVKVCEAASQHLVRLSGVQ